MDVDRDRRPVRRLRTEAEFLRSRCRHRARRRGAAAAFRASGGDGGRPAIGQEPRVLRRGQYPHARPATHVHKVNFCKFTNETRMAIEDCRRQIPASAGSRGGQRHLRPAAATNSRWPPITSCWSTTARRRFVAGTAAAGGAARHRRPDAADRQAQGAARPRRLFCTTEEGSRASAPSNGGWSMKWCRRAGGHGRGARARARRQRSSATATARASRCRRWSARSTADGIRYGYVAVECSTARRSATITIAGPGRCAACRPRRHHRAGRRILAAALARELDDAILHLRLNEPEVGAAGVPVAGRCAPVLAADALLEANGRDWLVREIRRYLKRVFKRVDVTSRRLVDADRAGQLFRRHAGRTGVRRRPLHHVDRPECRATTARRRRSTLSARISGLPDGQRPDAAGDALPRPSQPTGRAQARIGETLDAGGRSSSGWSPRARRHRLGRRGAPDAGGARQLLARLR